MFKLVVLSLLAAPRQLAATTTPATTVTTTPATTTTTTPGASYQGSAVLSSARRLSDGRRLVDLTETEVETAMCNALSYVGGACTSTASLSGSTWTATYTVTVPVADATLAQSQLNGITTDILKTKLEAAFTGVGKTVTLTVTSVTPPVSIAPVSTTCNVAALRTCTTSFLAVNASNATFLAASNITPVDQCTSIGTLVSCLSAGCSGCDKAASGIADMETEVAQMCNGVCAGQSYCNVNATGNTTNYIVCAASRLFEIATDEDENDEMQELAAAPAAAWALPFMGVAGMLVLAAFIGIGIRRKSRARTYSTYANFKEDPEEQVLAPEEQALAGPQE